MICINCDPVIAKPSGCNILFSQSMIYFGGVIAADGHNTSEINRRIGLAICEFASLQKNFGFTRIFLFERKLVYFMCLLFPTLCMHLMAFG